MNSLPDWSDRTCVIMASGPSLTQEQVDLANDSKAKTIVVNSTYRMAPLADVLYAGDFLFWKTNFVAARKNFPGILWTGDRTSEERYGIHRVKCVNRPGLGLKNIHTNGNSGFQAINLAFLFGCRRILLVGFDMKVGRNGEKHWHADHPSPLMQAQCFDEWLHKSVPFAADLYREGCNVINCTPGSALTCFPMSTLEKELA